MDKTFAIRSSVETRVTVNVLPCRIQYEGPTKISKRYWQPKDDSQTTKTVHFRGRKLMGRQIKLPRNYQGVGLEVGQKTLLESRIHTPQTMEEAQEEDEEELSRHTVTNILERVCIFDAIVLYDHDQHPTEDHELIRGIEEWIDLAETIHIN